ncbi:MAG: hypothetical protein R6X34_23385 [Chloroflexota bacterium]
MNQIVPNSAFRRLAITLQQPALPARSEPHWPYPLPEAEMIARYGLRRLAPVEQAAFPGLHLVLRVFKARLTKPPAVMPQARTDWVVWLAETYPYHYLVRMPGGAALLAPYHDMRWTVVTADTPVTTMASARQEAQAQQWRRTLPQSVRRSLSLPDAR